LYARLQPYLGARTIVASNTSTIPIARLAAGMKEPNRFCGMHFFHPVDRRPLVEVVCGPQTDEHTITTAAAHVRAISRRPILVEDGPGFVVNRLLFPHLTQALELLREGVAVQEIEQAATDFGMAMGPLQLMDEIGLDTTLQAGWVLSAAFPERIVASPLLVSMVKARQLGCKSGVGFFLHNDLDEPNGSRHVNPALGKRIAQWVRPAHGRKHTPQSIADRLLLPMVLEAARILEESMLLSPSDIDQGAVLGLGFPASRGGLLRWADTLGAAEILRRLQSLGDGACYQPPAVLTDLALCRGTFYPRNGQQ
jgi:3-hydroxyacyl-CoA dehydrogenase/enoyl-CoA hydratase/3-hydroxybutyryl-CoA epimerase/3-hydroxyacyl-CoA dehydrogenase/enoyl-CoA hydratase/3-hydroxybutyryl-CoA epimerase/enoyl-CoA isomerase